jgi:hypothetical protein
VTLNVSLRVPDGIVLASDSLATLMSSVNQRINVEGNCHKCGTKVEIKDVQTPPLTIPSSTWPYAQKMYPIQGRYGLATWGAGFVNYRSIYNHIIELADSFPKAIANEDHLEKMTEFVTKYFHDQLLSEWKRTNLDVNLQPDGWHPFGFQLCGFTKDANGEPVPHTHLINIGKTPTIERIDSIGCTWSGDGSVVGLLWPKTGVGAANYAAFSLQDAIDYAKFLIRTTADFQRFSGRLPTVGGEIDIALITNRRGSGGLNKKNCIVYWIERSKINELRILSRSRGSSIGLL